MEKRSSSKLPVYIAALLLVMISLLLLIVLVSFDANADTDAATLTGGVSSETVVAILQNADAGRGSDLIEEYGCIACHRLAVDNGVAPSFVGIGERAEQRHPPLNAPVYIYESITNPQAFVVEGYPP